VGNIVGMALAAIAAISALAFIAYKHPRAYPRLALILIIVVALCTCSGLIWELSIENAESALVRSGLIPHDKVTQMHDTLSAFLLPQWVPNSATGAILYFCFLLSFPLWLLEKKPAQDARAKNDQETESMG
jgi:hypothetical protein